MQMDDAQAEQEEEYSGESDRDVERKSKRVGGGIHSSEERGTDGFSGSIYGGNEA